jgi:hypothetical protein
LFANSERFKNAKKPTTRADVRTQFQIWISQQPLWQFAEAVLRTSWFSTGKRPVTVSRLPGNESGFESHMQFAAARPARKRSLKAAVREFFRDIFPLLDGGLSAAGLIQFISRHRRS